MSPKEVHIYIRQALEKLSSYQPENLHSSEIDFHFNRNQERYIDKLISNGFQDTQVSLDEISEIIIRDHALVTYRDTSPSLNYVYGILPANYRNIVNVTSEVTDSTSASLCENLGTVPLQDALVYTSSLAFPTTNLGSAPYFSRFTFKINAVSKFSTQSTSYDDGFNSTDSRYELVDYFINEINNQGNDFQVYWEGYLGSNTSPGTFTVQSLNSAYLAQDAEFEIYQSDKTTIDDETDNPFTTTTLQSFDVNQLENKRTRWSPTRMVENDKLILQLNTPYYKPTKHQPIATITQGKINIYQDESFIVNNILLTYVRRPKKQSLSLEQACELSETATRRIADMTIEYLSAYLNRPDTNNLLQVNRIND